MGVLLEHLGVAPIGHYSVLVFFVISGYCIAASAQSSLQRGLSFWSFMARRARRIYPPYLLAIAFFAVTRYFKAILHPSVGWHASASEWLQNLTLTQWVTVPWHPIAWPSANPRLFVAAFWSLNYEEQFYLVIAGALVLAVRFRLKLIHSVLALLVCALIWNGVVPGQWITGVFIEYWAHFALGVLLFWVLCVDTMPTARLAYASGLILLCLCCSLRIDFWGHGDVRNALRSYVELDLLSVLCVALMALRPYSDSIAMNWLWTPAAALGTISYSLYLVQQFNLTIVATVARYIVPNAHFVVLMTVVQVLLHVTIAASFWYFCERPFLRGRSGLLSAAASSPSQSATASGQ